PQAEQISGTPRNLSLIDLGAELGDFADTAAVLSQLDLLICADTSVAHLAGALATPVWMLVPTPSDWRWLEGCDDSPWYPTMRLFRQVRQGDWDEVVKGVTRALSTHIEQRRSWPNPSPHTFTCRTSIG